MFHKALNVCDAHNIGKYSGSRHSGTGTVPLNHHRIFFITFRSQQDDIVTAFQTVERVVAPTSCKPTEAFPSSSLATKRQCLFSLSSTLRRASKSASRLAFHLIHMPKEEVKRLADTMVEARENVRYCKECCTLTDQELCPICSNLNRDHKIIMVVENTRDLAAYEKTGKYNRRLPCTSRRNLPDAWHVRETSS